jgi:endonuclease/exonuclease/phosphatase family metal-dependent hydrolase
MDNNEKVNRSLKIITYNIFFGQLDTDTPQDIDNRIQLLCAQLQSLDADVICLQEVLPERYDRIKTFTSTIYPYSYPDKITQTYDTAIISKYPFVKRSKVMFTLTSMNRSILFVAIESPFDPNALIGIANSHLESEFGNIPSEQNKKMVQYSEAEDILDQISEMCDVTDIILSGDFNSHNDLSDSRLYSYFRYRDHFDETLIGWRDAWIETGSDPSKENTFDSTTNPLMLKLHSRLVIPPYYVSRLDRILHRSSLYVHDFTMIKTNLLISDHYPIIATFRADPPIITIPYIEYDLDRVSITKTNSVKRNTTKSSKSLSTKLKTVSLFK